MKYTLLLFFLALLFIPTADAQQKGEEVLPDFEQDVAALAAGISDSLSFEKIIERIRATRHDPGLSLRYVAFFEAMHARYPDMPKDTLSLTRLKSNRYNELAWNKQDTDVDLALRQLDTSDQLARSINFTQGLLRNEYGRGVIYRIKGDYENALLHFQQYLAHYREPFDSARVASVQFQIGVCFLELGRLKESIEALSSAAAIDEALDRPNYAYNTLGNAYRRAGLFDKSEAAFQKGYAGWLKRGDRAGQARVLMNLGNLKMETGEREAAKLLFLRSLKLNQENKSLLAYSAENLGNWYLQAEQYDSAFYYINRSYQLRKSFDNPRELYIIEHQLGRVYMARGQYELALPLLLQAYEVSREMGEPEKIRDIAADLSQWYEDRGNYRRALQYKEAFITAKDSLLNGSIARAIADVSEKYETEQKERTIEQLNTQNQLQANLLQLRQRQLLIVSIGAVLLVGLLLTIFSLYRRVKVQNQVIQKNLREKETLLKEIHHRVKNNLQVIASLLRIQSRQVSDAKAKAAIRESRSRVRSMALIHEDLYREDHLSGVSMDVYLNKLANDIFRVYNIAPDRISMQTDIEPIRLDVETVIPIGLIVNELITNALKHAFPGERSGCIYLYLKEQADQLILTLEDDGQGLKEKGTAGSFGMSMIETFQEKLEGHTQLESQNGTRIRMTIHNYKKLEPVLA